jgi:membrane associated rhomboid family serine protease
MIAQVTAGAQVEREMGTVPFLLVYFAGGIYGFVLGGNFSRTGIPSVGASGALFATVGTYSIGLKERFDVI